MDLEEIVVHPRTPQQETGLAVLRDAIFERQLLSERRRLSVGDAVGIRFDSDACTPRWSGQTSHFDKQ